MAKMVNDQKVGMACAKTEWVPPKQPVQAADEPKPAKTYKMRYHRLFNLGNYENESIDIEDTFSNNMPDVVALMTLKTRVMELHKKGSIGKKAAVEDTPGWG